MAASPAQPHSTDAHVHHVRGLWPRFALSSGRALPNQADMSLV
jgi:hypothetical protein